MADARAKSFGARGLSDFVAAVTGKRPKPPPHWIYGPGERLDTGDYYYPSRIGGPGVTQGAEPVSGMERLAILANKGTAAAGSVVGPTGTALASGGKKWTPRLLQGGGKGTSTYEDAIAKANARQRALTRGGQSDKLVRHPLHRPPSIMDIDEGAPYPAFDRAIDTAKRHGLTTDQSARQFLRTIKRRDAKLDEGDRAQLAVLLRHKLHVARSLGHLRSARNDADVLIEALERLGAVTGPKVPK